MPTPSVKVLIAELGGVELDNQEEFDLTASVIPFSSPGFVSTNIRDAILEGGVDHHAAQYLVDISDVVRVSAKKQMRTFQEQTVIGELIIDGWLVVE